MPLVFYLIWQAIYWILVQVLLEGYIRRNHLDTSFKSIMFNTKSTTIVLLVACGLVGIGMADEILHINITYKVGYLHCVNTIIILLL